MLHTLTNQPHDQPIYGLEKSTVWTNCRLIHPRKVGNTSKIDIYSE